MYNAKQNASGIKKNALPKWLLICIMVAGLALIVLGLLKIFGGDALVDKFNELQASAADMKNDFVIAGSLLSGTGAKEKNKDYAGIISDLQTALTKFDDAEAKVESASATLTELQNIIDSSSDQNVKTTGARFIDAFKARNAAVLKMASDAKDFVNQAIIYFNEVANNQKITIDLVKFGAAADAFAANAQGMTSIGAQYDAATNDFAKAAGFTLEKK